MRGWIGREQGVEGASCKIGGLELDLLSCHPRALRLVLRCVDHDRLEVLPDYLGELTITLNFVSALISSDDF